MMTIAHSVAAPETRSGRGAAFAVLTKLAAMIRTWRERRAWRIDLRRLDDHMLRDIGMERSDAEAEIAKPFWHR